MTETYTIAKFGVIRDSDAASIPEDLDNRDWRAYQEWLTAGNTPNPMPVPAPEPNAAVEAALVTSARDKIATYANLTPEEQAAVFPGTP